MKTKFWLLLVSFIMLATAIGAYIWATTIMDSLTEFRSPFSDSPPAPGEALGEALTGRVVIILVDALREDTARNAEVMPFLDSLRQQGAWATMNSHPPSFSAPGWTTILTGAWPDINDSQPINPPDDDSVRPISQDTIFTAASRSGFQTAVSGHAWFESMLANANVDTGFYTIEDDNAADIQVVDNAKLWLREGSYQLILIHLDQVDYAGHYQGGPLNPNWNAAAARVDSLIDEIFAQLDLDKDTVIILSDHGQIDRGGHGGQDAITLIEPFIMVGNAVAPGKYADIQMIDVAPTVAALLGTNLPASSQGQVLTEMLNLTAGQSEKIAAAEVDQQEGLLTNYLAAIDESPSTQGTTATFNELRAAMETARTDRLTRERIPRGILALVFALIPAGFLLKKRDTHLLWLFFGAVLYGLVFNLIYVLAGRTYSLSSATSANDVIISTAEYSGAAMLIGWLVIALIRRVFSRSPSEAARWTLSLTLMILYTLLLPVLWNYFRNGAVVTWTLPEMGSMFLGFLSILQGLYISIFGLVFAAVSALIAKLTR